MAAHPYGLIREAAEALRRGASAEDVASRLDLVKEPTPRATYRRPIELVIKVYTNMNSDELTSLVEGTCVSIEEFGKEHIDVPRYDAVSIEVDYGVTHWRPASH